MEFKQLKLSKSLSVKFSIKNIKIFQDDPFLLKGNHFEKFSNDIQLIMHKNEENFDIEWKKYKFIDKNFNDIKNYLPSSLIKSLSRSYKSILNEYYWKLPSEILNNRDFKNICAIGCGSGVELYFLRKKFPNSKIVAVNWVNDIPVNLLKKLKIDFFVEDLYEFLLKNKSKFDLIFSNYVLEHSPDINKLLFLIKESLTEKGVTINCLPLHFYNNNFVKDRLEKFANKLISFDNFDMSLLDPGHSWKTNPNDIFSKCSLFSNTKIIGNYNYVVRYFNFSKDSWIYYLKLIQVLNAFFYQPIIYLFRYTHKLCRFNLIVRIFYKLEKKIFFSNYKLQNFVPSVLLICFK